MLEKYKLLCLKIIGSGYQTSTIVNYLKNHQRLKDVVVLRHDVDRNISNALKMAKLEHSLGVYSTFYFRHTPLVFNQPVIEQIAEMGHEIGFHYETLSKAHGDMEKALKLFGNEISEFRAITSIETISMHGSPMSPFDNRDLWIKNDIKKFDLLGEAYLSIDYQNLLYFTDTGRSWQRNYSNLRDHHPEMKTNETVRTTNELIAFINEKSYPRICISAHPERWASNFPRWAYSAGFDSLTNVIKSGLHFFADKTKN